MTATAPAPSRLRIAITSPDILARIRQVFAGRNLAVEFVELPYVEVLVSRPADAVAPPESGLPALNRGGPVDRLSAEYRLNVVGVGPKSAPEAEPPDRGWDRRAAGLSPRLREVMALVSDGVRNCDIAVRLGLSEKTVKNHINRIFRVLEAESRVEAVLIWQRHLRAVAARRRLARISGGAR